MSVKRPVSWFLTDQGRKFSFSVITGTSLALTAARFTPHTFFLHKYKDFVHYYNEGKPVELPSDLHNIYQKCLDLLSISETHRKLIEPFSVFGFDLFHAGSTSSRFGALVGIPVNFSYKILEDVEKQNVQVNQKNIDLKSEIGNNLGTYFLMKDMTEVYYETSVDKKLCELGPDYIESGITFYDKLLQRNQALRELMGKEGEKKYTINGNENYTLRQPHVALVHRKQYFEHRSKQNNEDFNEHFE
ncbi:jg4368 [Pararge aegeria aegeria]|uniref:Jg4368 protein n=1 Tax=Pararge aegeria aegeria TaxID=348720 RepID=A0A8S4RNK3_9NEOP|nr:jg4368 [Pararge aegeria aegeria]